ncbi:MAG: hypothetical protein KKC75_07880 [Nanoarchaeota archaeon]|nr:hypothetical protein [Nanoarchaeota archaeon]MBU1004741.1 hypothetical protein [Nanoarchaeota archaeon]MBU1945686.1 hypothetical protein [Nanoarchaeota archaeon]
MFDQKEKDVLRILVKKELERFEKEENSIMDKSPKELKLEVSYDEFLKNIIKKLK